MRLYELSAEFQAAMADMTARLEAGTITPEILADTMEGIGMDWDTKALSTAKYLAGLRAEADAIKAAIGRMGERCKVVENAADRLDDYLLGEVVAVGRCPKDAEIAIALRKSEAVVIDDAQLLPAKLMREVPAKIEPDKVAIKAALKDGLLTRGAHIETRHNLQIK